MTTHCIISDVQVRPEHDTSFLNWIGRFIVDKKPDVIVQLGDFADMASLSSYDKGLKSYEGRSYMADIDAAYNAMEVLCSPLHIHNYRASHYHRARYKPRMVMTLGNHENRIDRAINSDRKLDGLISVKNLGYKIFGWEVYPFLDVVNIDGVHYSHYFTSGVMGRPVTSARALLTKKHQSCVMGHVQTMDIATDYRADGTPITALFAGCSYMHNEDYLGPQGNRHFRGIHMLYEVNNGSFFHHPISLNYLERKYGQ